MFGGALQYVAERDQGVRAQPLRRLGYQPVDLLVPAEAVCGPVRVVMALVACRGGIRDAGCRPCCIPPA